MSEALRLEDPPPPKLGWSGNVTVGATYTDGNSNTKLLAFSADAERRGEHDRVTMKAFRNYATQKDSTGTSQTTQDNGGLNGEYDYFATKKLYYLGGAGAEFDREASLDLRWWAGPGAGYQFREDEKLKVNGEVGVTYFSEDYTTAGADQDYIAARVAYHVAWQATKDTSLEHGTEAFPSLEDKDDFYAKVDTRLKTNLTEKMFASLEWVWDYDNTPAAGKERSDHRVILGLGWSF